MTESPDCEKNMKYIAAFLKKHYNKLVIARRGEKGHRGIGFLGSDGG